MKARPAALVAAMIGLGAFLLCATAFAQPTYVGSDSCKPCHEAKWNDFRVSGHPYKLHKAEDVKTWPLPLPEGHDWSDISYVIGGYGWKVRYMDLNGYIITSAGGKLGNNQFNLKTGEWVDYHAGEVKPYNCGSCHTTGFSPTGHQEGLPGIDGTWAFEGVQCEACHGPASDHVAVPSSGNIVVDKESTLCGQCHVRGDPQTIPASGGFVRHHEQYNELLKSPHGGWVGCFNCHDAHKKSEYSIKNECVDCHTDMVNEEKYFTKTGQKHLAREVGCVDCHMPFAAKSAVAENKYKGDIRSHQFVITTDKNATMFTPDGKFANGKLTPAYACLGCHVEIVEKYAATPENAELWALRRAREIHK